VFLGDLLDKGPDSAGTVARVRRLRDEGFDVVLIKGNHEEKHERFRAAYARAGNKVRMGGADLMRAISEALTEDDISLLESAVLYYEMPGILPGERDAIAVHAGFPGSMERLPTPAEQASLSQRERKRLEQVLRVRHVTGKHRIQATVEYTAEVNFDREDLISPDFHERVSPQVKEFRKTVRPAGRFIRLGENSEDDPFWAEVYDGRFGHVFFGHEPHPTALEPVQFRQATALDIGSVFGGRLAAAILRRGQEPSFVSVASSGRFTDLLWEG